MLYSEQGCGALFSMEHTLSSSKGGLIGQRHNEIWDTNGDLSALAWEKVVENQLSKRRHRL